MSAIAQAGSDWLSMSSGSSLSAQIEVVRDHEFKVKPGTKHVCVHCGENRMFPIHGVFSYQTRGRPLDNRFTYQKVNEAWQEKYLELLKGTELQRDCNFIEVQGIISFPDNKKRDEDNHRFAMSKFLGDALQKGGYIANDDWASFRFRELDLGPSVPGQQSMRLLLSAS